MFQIWVMVENSQWKMTILPAKQRPVVTEDCMHNDALYAVRASTDAEYLERMAGKLSIILMQQVAEKPTLGVQEIVIEGIDRFRRLFPAS